MLDLKVSVNDEIITKTTSSLEKNGFSVEVVDNLEDAKSLVSELIPKDSEVFTATSETLREAGIDTLINESGDYDSLRNKLMDLYQKHPEQVKERKALTAAPEYVIGSAAAITEDGQVMVGSATGSQLAPEVYGADHVIYVVSAKKIVKDVSDGIKRIKEHVFPLEIERVKVAYGNPDMKTYFSKLLVYVEDYEKRVQVIIVKESAGF